MPPTDISTADKLAAVTWISRLLQCGRILLLYGGTPAAALDRHLEAFSALEGELAERLAEEEQHGERGEPA